MAPIGASGAYSYKHTRMPIPMHNVRFVFDRLLNFRVNLCFVIASFLDISPDSVTRYECIAVTMRKSIE